MDDHTGINHLVTGVALFVTPIWSHILADINLFAAAVASVSGAVIGVWGVVHILRGKHGG